MSDKKMKIPGSEITILDLGAKIILMVFIGFVTFALGLLVATMLSGCSSVTLPKPDTTLTKATNNTIVKETIDIIDLRNKYVKARRSWDGFLYWFSYEDVPKESRGAVRKSITHVTDGFEHVKIILSSIKEGKYDTSAIKTVEIPLVYKNSRNAILSLKSVYKRNENRLTPYKKQQYIKLYNNLKALDKKFKGKVDQIENLSDWLDLIADITDVIQSVKTR